MCNEPELYLRIGSKQFGRKRFKARLFYRRLFARERRLVRRRFARSVVADQYNAERFRSIFGITPHISAYGIDHDYFAKAADGASVVASQTEGRFVVLQSGIKLP